jgi:hypothetical protein
MSQIFKSSSGGGAISSITGTNGVVVSPTTGNVVVSLGGLFKYTYRATATNTTMLPTEALIGVTDTSVVRTISLPDPTISTVLVGQVFIINDESLHCSVNNISINVLNAACLLDGVATQVLDVDGESMSIYFNGTNYYIM